MNSSNPEQVVILGSGPAGLAAALYAARAELSPLLVRGEEISVGASVGVAVHPQDGCDFDVLLHTADVAMYRSKAQVL